MAKNKVVTTAPAPAPAPLAPAPAPAPLAPATVLANYAAAGAATSGPAAGSIAAQAAGNAQVLAICVAAGLATAPGIGYPFYKPTPPTSAQRGFGAAALAIGNAMYAASNGKGYTAAQFKVAFVMLAPGAYRGGPWGSWLPANKKWAVVSGS